MFLIMDKVKESGFRRLLEAGSASVVMETELSLSTHAFVDTSHLKSSGNVRIQTHNHNNYTFTIYSNLYNVRLSLAQSCVYVEVIRFLDDQGNLMQNIYG